MVAECCRWPVGDPPKRPRWSEAEIDWQRVARIAARHRVEGLVWNSLTARDAPLPGDVAASLKAASERILHENLEAARESLLLQSAFRHAGIAILFLKGITLAELAYGTLAFKSGRDIDLLVRSDDVDSAADTLITQGYTCTYPRCAAERLGDWHLLCKESVWRHPRRSTMVELHSRLFDNPLLQPTIDIHNQQLVRIGDSSLPTLPRDELFSYLCLHGANSAWSRLKWLADFAALIAPLGPRRIVELHRRAESVGAGRAASTALLMSEKVLGLALPDSLRHSLQKDRLARALAWVSLRKMTGRYTDSEIKDHRFGTLSIHLMQPFLLPGWRFAMAEIRRLCSRPEDQLELSSNSWWAPLRPLRLLARKLAQPLRAGPRGR